MNPRTCIIRNNPPESYGDCIRACLNTILDRDDVPHVFDNRDVEESWYALGEWSKENGYSLFRGGYDENPMENMAIVNPDVPYMLLCSCGGTNHAVVCKGRDMLHDPAWYRTAITGPTASGLWIVVVVSVSAK